MLGQRDRRGARGALRRGLSLVLLSLACARTSEPSDEQAAAPATAPLVERGAPAVDGCMGLRRVEGRSYCRLRKPKPLRAWLPGRSDATIRVELDGEALPSTTTRDAEGLVVAFEASALRGSLALYGVQGDVWRLELEPGSDAVIELRKQANAAMQTGDFAGALAVFDAAPRRLAPDELDLLRCDEARVALAAREYERLFALADSLADSPTVVCAATAHLLAAYVLLLEQPDFDAAAAHLEAAARVAAHDVETAISLRYHEGIYEHRLGHLDESLVAFVEAARMAERIGDETGALAARTMEAVALARLGRLDEAERGTATILATLGERAAGDPLVRDVRYDLAWIALLRREVDPHAPDPSASLRELIGEYERAQAPSDVDRTRLHLVHALLQSGALDEAARELDGIAVARLDVHARVWFELAAFELALARAEPGAAEQALERAERFASLTFDRDHHYRLAAARAALARARGDHDDALAWLRKASTIADELALAVPGAAGRSMLVTSHRRADVELLELLVELGRPDEALCVAVGARARHLRALWARARPRLSDADERELRSLLGQHRAARKAIETRLADAWQLPADELAALERELERDGEAADRLLRRATELLERDAPSWSCERVAPQAGEALLAMAPSSRGDAWHFFAWRSAAPVEHVLVAGELAPRERAELALARLDSLLLGLDTLRVIPSGVLTSVDFHALPATRSLAVAYSLGLGRASAEVQSHERRASVVVGSRDLAAARDEGREVEAALARGGWTVDARWSPEAPEQPTLLHYAGHGVHAGPDGWDSHIEVPEHGRLSAAHIVALQRAPALVVLGACSTGATRDDILDGGMNLAVALLLAGAELVIAPSGPVDDHTALALARTLHHDTAPSPDTLVGSLATAHHADPNPDPTSPRSFARWRAWVP